MHKPFDYLIVGAGLYGAVFAYEMNQAGKRCLVVEKRNHIAGNAFTEEIAGIQVHRYGAHIFHTSLPHVWTYVNRFGTFNRFTNAPLANFRGKLFNLPFNMNTFYQMWGTLSPAQAQKKIAEQQQGAASSFPPKNLEEQAIHLVGHDIYKILIKGYTEKQWGRPCTDLPPFIIKRLPVRFTFDNNYFDDPYQGIPTEGYTSLVSRMLVGIEVKTNTDFLKHRNELSSLAKKVVFTGPVDEYFDHRLGRLDYRSLRFETEVLDMPNYQGNAVVNYTDTQPTYTRIIEHKHFTFGTQPQTVISREYSLPGGEDTEPYYPVNDEHNNSLYESYKQLTAQEKNVLFGGRLGEYRYYNMDQIIASALLAAQAERSRF